MEMQSAEIKDLVTALSKAQASIKPAKKDTDNPYFKSKYADLAAIHEACMDHLTANGLSVTQTLDTQDGKTVLVTTLFHTSGQWIKSVAPIIPVKNDSQGIGSAITYMRRYSLAALVGVSQEDDDGNSASGNSVPKNAKTKEDVQAANAMNMAYDESQNEEAWKQALGRINAIGTNKALDDLWNQESKRWKHLPASLYQDLEMAAANKRQDLNSNGKYIGV